MRRSVLGSIRSWGQKMLRSENALHLQERKAVLGVWVAWRGTLKSRRFHVILLGWPSFWGEVCARAGPSVFCFYLLPLPRSLSPINLDGWPLVMREGRKLFCFFFFFFKICLAVFSLCACIGKSRQEQNHDKKIWVWVTGPRDEVHLALAGWGCTCRPGLSLMATSPQRQLIRGPGLHQQPLLDRVPLA